jgi:hypothetical protein
MICVRVMLIGDSKGKTIVPWMEDIEIDDEIH